LAKLGHPLFPENFEKWENGPVCRELYSQHIGKFDLAKHEIPKELCSGKKLSNEQLGIIEEVLYKYGCMDGEELSNLSHSEDPWKTAGEWHSTIPNECMKNFYFGIWGMRNDAQSSESRIVTDADIGEAIKEAENGKIYDSADELFRDLNGYPKAQN
jgi:hypothetical protein